MLLITTLVVSFLVCRVLEVSCGLAGVVSGLQPSPHLTSNTQQTKNERTNVVINNIVASS